MQLKINKALKKDHLGILDLYTQFLLNTCDSPIELMDKCSILLRDRNFKTLVVKDGAKIVGFVIYTYKTNVRYPKPIVEIVELFLKQEYKGGNVEGKLMEEIFNFTSEKDSFYTINTYQIDDKSNIESIKFQSFAYHYMMDI